MELKAEEILWLGKCDNSRGKYPLSKKGQSMESLRERLHLRPRTNIIGAVARIRNALAHATHTFFQSRGFLYVHTPLITTSDCEGAGEMFQASLMLHRRCMPTCQTCPHRTLLVKAGGWMSKVESGGTTFAAVVLKSAGSMLRRLGLHLAVCCAP